MRSISSWPYLYCSWLIHVELAGATILCLSSNCSQGLGQNCTGWGHGIVVPDWPTRAWYSLLAWLCIQCPILLRPSSTLLKLPSHPDQRHALHPKLILLVCLVSGVPSKPEVFRQWLKTSTYDHGEHPQRLCTDPIYTNGRSFVVRDIKIHFLLPWRVELTFLQTWQQKISYSAVNMARSALLALLPSFGEFSFSAYLDLVWLMKGIYVANQNIYNHIWDVIVVLSYCENLGPSQDLTLKQLSFRPTMLLALLLGQCSQMLQALDITHMKLVGSECGFMLNCWNTQARVRVKHQLFFKHMTDLTHCVL